MKAEHSVECTVDCPGHGAVVTLLKEWEVSAEVFLFALCHTQVGRNTFLLVDLFTLPVLWGRAVSPVLVWDLE